MFLSARMVTSVLMGFTCLASAAGAMAQNAAGHDITSNLMTRYLDAGKAAGQTPAAAPAPAGAQPSTAAITSAAQADAGSVATESAAATGTCDSYFTQSQALSANLGAAFTAMNARDMMKAGAALPALQTQLNALPAVEVKPEVCNGNHINAYTSYQYTQLSTLRDHGVDNGFPTSLPLVKQPDLNQASVAYAVGWIKYEQNDFTGALAAYGKGLAMFPHSHELQNEYLATLVQMQNGQGVLDYADKVLGDTYDLDDTMRGKVYAARAIGLVLLGRLPEADDSLTISLRYSYSDDVAAMQTQVRAAIPPKK